MKYCSNCGEPLEDGSLFCSVCGAEAEAEPASEPVPAEASADAPALEPAAEPVSEKPAKKKRKLWWLAIPAALLVLAFAAGLIINLTGAYAKLLPASRKKFEIYTKEALTDALDRAFANNRDAVAPESVKANVEASVKIEMNEDSGDYPGLSESAMLLNLINQLTVNADVDIDKTGAKLKLNASVAGMELIEAFLKTENGKIMFAVPKHLDYLYSIDPASLLETIGSGELPDSDKLDKIDPASLDEEKLRAEIMEIYEILMKVLDDEDTVLDIEKKKEIALSSNGGSTVGDVYTITPSENALKVLIEELADHFNAESSYIGGIVKKIADGEDVFGEMKSSAEETAKELHDKHLSVKIALDGKDVPFISVDADDFSFYTDHASAGDTASRYLEAAPKGRSNNALIKVLVNHKDGSEQRLSGTVSLTDDKEEPAFDMDLDGNELTLAFDLDLKSRSAIGTYAGEITVKLGSDEVASVTVKPEGERMLHIVKLVSPEPDSVLQAITATIYVKEGEAVTLPALPDKEIGSQEELQEVFGELVESLFGTLMQLFFGGFGF